MKDAPNPFAIIENFFTMILEKGWTWYVLSGLALLGLFLFIIAKP